MVGLTRGFVLTGVQRVGVRPVRGLTGSYGQCGSSALLGPSRAGGGRGASMATPTEGVPAGYGGVEEMLQVGVCEQCHADWFAATRADCIRRPCAGRAPWLGELIKP